MISVTGEESKSLRFIWNVLRDRDARARIFLMRNVFRRYQSNLAAVMLVGVKRS